MTAADSGPTIELLPGRMKLASDLAEAVLLLARFVTEQPGRVVAIRERWAALQRERGYQPLRASLH